MRITSIITTLAAVTSVTLATTSIPASAYTFGNVTGGDTVGDAFSSNFSFNVVDNGNNTVLFNISKANTNDSMFVGTVYFDVNNTLLTSVNQLNFNNVGNVNFEGGASTANMPQGNILGFSTDYSFDNINGAGNKWAVQSGETLGILFNGNYTNVVSAINSGALKIGLHVQNVLNSSDTYVSNVPTVNATPKPVPEPATILGLGVVAAAGMVMARRHKFAN